MKILIVFNHPAPYKVDFFNKLNKEIEVHAIFERTHCSNRSVCFYGDKKHDFTSTFLKRGAFGEENSNTGELVNFLKKHHSEYDAIIMNGYSTVTEMRAIRYLNKNKIKWILFVNGGLIKKDNFIKGKLKRYLISTADKYFSPSASVNEYLIHYGAREKDIYNYPNSTIQNSEILAKPLNYEEKMDLRLEFNLPLKSKIFISPSQFIDRKNNLQLLKLFAHRQEKLLLVGEGEEKQEYLSFIKEHDLTNIIIRDFVDKQTLLKLFSCTDCFITLSKEDIYGHTTNEAMSQGIPVIASERVVSSHHLIKNGVNGYIVPLDNENAINLAIDSVKDVMGYESLLISRENTIEKMIFSVAEAFKEIEKL